MKITNLAIPTTTADTATLWYVYNTQYPFAKYPLKYQSILSILDKLGVKIL